jgi:hypothetical protein
MHTRYSEWIRFVFDHPVEGHLPEWYHREDAPEFIASHEDYAILLSETFSRSGNDLLVYSDGQVNQGLWYLTNPATSDFIHSLSHPTVSMNRRVESLRSVFDLYRDCFAKRCAETLGHTDEPGASELNPICYMFWATVSRKGVHKWS